MTRPWRAPFAYAFADRRAVAARHAVLVHDSNRPVVGVERVAIDVQCHGGRRHSHGVTVEAAHSAEDVPEFTLGWRLRRALARAHITAKEMARLLGVSRYTVTRWIRDETVPAAAYLHEWADLCRVPREWLAGSDLPNAQTGREESMGEWVTISDAAARLGVSKAWMKKYAKAEGIEVRVNGARSWVKWSEVQGWVERSRIEPQYRPVPERDSLSRRRLSVAGRRPEPENHA